MVDVSKAITDGFKNSSKVVARNRKFADQANQRHQRIQAGLDELVGLSEGALSYKVHFFTGTIHFNPNLSTYKNSGDEIVIVMDRDLDSSRSKDGVYLLGDVGQRREIQGIDKVLSTIAALAVGEGKINADVMAAYIAKHKELTPNTPQGFFGRVGGFARRLVS